MQGRAGSIQGCVELVTHAVDCTDHLLVGKKGGHLLTQVLDVGVNGAVVALEFISLHLMRSEDLNYYDYTPASTVDDDRTAYEALEELITRLEPRLIAMEKRYQEADARYENFVTRYLKDLPGGEAMLKPLACAVKVQEVRIEAVNLALVHLVLRAPADGRVEEIHCRAGEVADLGLPVVTLVNARPAELIAYVPEEQILLVKPGIPVKVRRKASPSTLYTAMVSHTGAAIQRLPDRLAPLSTLPLWGLSVHITLPNELYPKPGEAFEVIS
jgi:multidrug resistance efflux pump